MVVSWEAETLFWEFNPFFYSEFGKFCKFHEFGEICKLQEICELRKICGFRDHCSDTGCATSRQPVGKIVFSIACFAYFLLLLLLFHLLTY